MLMDYDELLMGAPEVCGVGGCGRLAVVRGADGLRCQKCSEEEEALHAMALARAERIHQGRGSNHWVNFFWALLAVGEFCVLFYMLLAFLV